MKDQKFKMILGIEILLIAIVLSAAVTVPDQSTHQSKIFELIGASLGVLITTSGLYWIREFT